MANMVKGVSWLDTSERDGAPWGMGHIGDGAHGQWGTWTMGYMGILRTDGQWQTWSKGYHG